MGKLLLKAGLCALGGVLGWLMMEPSMPSSPTSPVWATRERAMVLVCVLLIGLAAGFFSGLQKGSRRHMWTQMLLGAALGAVGGLIGYNIGGLAVATIYGPDVFVRGAPLPVTVTARMAAMAPFGLCLGAAIGSTNLTVRGLMAGAVGGFAGGLLAGVLFDTFAFVIGPLKALVSGTSEVGGPSRAATFLLIAFFVGLFSGIVDILTRHAWVRLVLGKNEGREWPLDSPVTTFGRDERALVPLFGDSNVLPLHANIVRQGRDYVLHDTGSPIGVGLNGARLTQPAVLNPGDSIQVGSHHLQFLMKGHGAQRGPEGRFAGVNAGAGGTPVQARPVAPMPVAAAPPGLTLVALTGPLTGTRYPLGSHLELGREGSGVRLSFDAQASRRHASLTPTSAGIALQDLGSTNGTTVNGQKVTSALLRAGDTIQIGQTSFRVE